MFRTILAAAALAAFVVAGCTAQPEKPAPPVLFAHEAHPDSVAEKPGACPACGAETKPITGSRVIYACEKPCAAPYSLAPDVCPICKSSRHIIIHYRGPEKEAP